jgi:hypothetical protein
MCVSAQELVYTLQQGHVPCHERLGEQRSRLRIELCLVVVGTKQSTIEQKKSAQ